MGEISLPACVCILLKAAQWKSSIAAVNASHRHLLHLLLISPSLCESSPMWKEADQTGRDAGGSRVNGWAAPRLCGGRLNDCFHLVLHASSTAIATAPGIITLITATECGLQPLRWAPGKDIKLFCYCIWSAQISVWHVFFFSLQWRSDLCRLYICWSNGSDSDAFRFILGWIIYIYIEIHQGRRKKDVKKHTWDLRSWYRTTQSIINKIWYELKLYNLWPRTPVNLCSPLTLNWKNVSYDDEGLRPSEWCSIND